MVEGHCAKRYADDARQKCVGKRVVEVIWRVVCAGCLGILALLFPGAFPSLPLLWWAPR